MSVASIEAVRQSQHRRQHGDGALIFQAQRLETLMLRRGHIFAMVPAQVRNHSTFAEVEARHIGIGNQIKRVLVMPRIADEVPNVVQIGAGFQQTAKRRRQLMHALQIMK